MKNVFVLWHFMGYAHIKYRAAWDTQERNLYCAREHVSSLITACCCKHGTAMQIHKFHKWAPALLQTFTLCANDSSRDLSWGLPDTVIGLLLELCDPWLIFGPHLWLYQGFKKNQSGVMTLFSITHPAPTVTPTSPLRLRPHVYEEYKPKTLI